MPAPHRLLSLRRSAPAKLALIAALFVIAVAVVRTLSLGSLANVDILSSEIRTRWLDSVQILGTLRHHTARVRTEEAEILLGGNAAQRQESSEQLKRYLDLAAKGIASYRKVPHDPEETRAFNIFVGDWDKHLQSKGKLVSLVDSGRIPEAIEYFHGGALDTFRKASHELHELLLLTHAKAEAARQEAAKAFETTQRFISDLILAMLLLFVGLSFYLWRSFSRPLLDLASRTHQLSTNDTKFEVPFENRRDEIGEMARSLSVLKRNTVELLESRKSLAMQAEVLSGALEKERELATAQRNFLTTMSHEIRTPLTYIDGHAQRLLATREHAAPEQIASRAEKIRSAVFQMTSLVVGLTAEMEMMNKPVLPQKSRFNPAAMLHDLASYYREIGLRIRFEEKTEGLPMEMTGDQKLLRCAISNLISNAIKYSPDGALVEISGKMENGAVAIAITDHGMGIPESELARVRERFFRGSNVGAIPGTGIGLSLVQQIVEQHGGQLSIESAPGQGTSAVVTLPLENRMPEPAETPREHDFVH